MYAEDLELWAPEIQCTWFSRNIDSPSNVSAPTPQAATSSETPWSAAQWSQWNAWSGWQEPMQHVEPQWTAEQWSQWNAWSGWQEPSVQWPPEHRDEEGNWGDWQRWDDWSYDDDYVYEEEEWDVYPSWGQGPDSAWSGSSENVFRISCRKMASWKRDKLGSVCWQRVSRQWRRRTRCATHLLRRGAGPVRGRTRCHTTTTSSPVPERTSSRRTDSRTQEGRERERQSELEPHSIGSPSVTDPAVDRPVLFGKHKGEMCSWVVRRDPGHVRWCLSKRVPSSLLRDFLEYVRSQPGHSEEPGQSSSAESRAGRQAPSRQNRGRNIHFGNAIEFDMAAAIGPDASRHVALCQRSTSGVTSTGKRLGAWTAAKKRRHGRTYSQTSSRAVSMHHLAHAARVRNSVSRSARIAERFWSGSPETNIMPMSPMLT